MIESNIFEVGRLSFRHVFDQDADHHKMTEFDFNLEDELIKDNPIRSTVKSLFETQSDLEELATENSAINSTVYDMIADNKRRWEEATGGMGGLEQMAVWVAILSNAILTVIIIGLVSKNYCKSKKLEGEVKGLGGGGGRGQDTSINYNLLERVIELEKWRHRTDLPSYESTTFHKGVYYVPEN